MRREAGATAADGLTTIRSSYGPKDRMIWLEAEVKAKGLVVLVCIIMRTASILSGQNKLDIKIRNSRLPTSDATSLPPFSH